MHENRVAVKENDAHLMTSNCIAACTYYAHNIPFLLAGILVDWGQPNQVPVCDRCACVHCTLLSLKVPCWLCTVLHANGDQA